MRIGALRYGGDGQTLGKLGGKVLHAVDREIDAPVEQGFFNFFGEQAFAADFVERDVENLVAGGFDDLDAAFGAARFQTFPDIVRLPERKLRASGPDDQHKSQCNQRIIRRVVAWVNAASVAFRWSIFVAFYN